MRWRTGKTYKPGGAREIARAQRQIAAGQLKAENGLIAAPVVVVIPEPAAEVVKPKRASRKKVLVVDDRQLGSTVSV